MVTRDNLWSLRNDFPVCHSALRNDIRKLIPGNECGRVARGYGNCWRLLQLLKATADCWQCPQYDRKCSFHVNYFSTQLQQTETSDTGQKAVYFLICHQCSYLLFLLLVSCSILVYMFLCSIPSIKFYSPGNLSLQFTCHPNWINTLSRYLMLMKVYKRGAHTEACYIFFVIKQYSIISRIRTQQDF